RDVQQLEGGLSRLADALLPAFDRVRTDVEQAGQKCLAGIEAGPYGANIGGLQRFGTRRQVGLPKVKTAFRGLWCGIMLVFLLAALLLVFFFLAHAPPS